ncbi:MAG: tetratricopeptide repeat protein [Candidatus Ozemobacteraceae bacterium]
MSFLLQSRCPPTESPRMGRIPETLFRHVLSKMACVCLSVLIIGLVSPAFSAQNTIPEWYRFSAALDGPPSIDAPSELIATLSCLLGEMTDIEMKLMLPANWTAVPVNTGLDRLASGTSRVFRFRLTPAGALPNGSIACSFSARPPKQAMLDRVKSLGMEGVMLSRIIQSMPEKSSGFTDIAFALFPEEGFFPLGSDMWLGYDDRLKTGELQRGPSFYQESMISPSQARTDVDMYDRLKLKLASEPAFAASLKEAGIDLTKKRADVCAGYYVLAQESYLKGAFADADAALNGFFGVSREIGDDRLGDLRTAAGNLHALVLWSKGDRKGAEAAFRETFYQRRKSPVQRYVLRNLGLMSLEKGDRATARESFRLGLDFKPGYALLSKEFTLLKK